jgi:hypothetical protein
LWGVFPNIKLLLSLGHILWLSLSHHCDQMYQNSLNC